MIGTRLLSFRLVFDRRTESVGRKGRLGQFLPDALGERCFWPSAVSAARLGEQLRGRPDAPEENSLWPSAANEGDRASEPQEPRTRRTAAAMRSELGRACGRTLPLGVGTGAVPRRTTGARSAWGQASATRAATSAPRPPVTHDSWTVTNLPVRATDSSTAPLSSG